MALGTGEVAVAATTAAATEGTAAVLGAGALGVKGGADFISGFTNVLDAASPNPKVDVKEANKALQTVADPAGLVTTITTGGNLDAGDKAATAVGLVTGAKDLTKLGNMTKLGKAVTVINAVQSGTSAADQMQQSAPPRPTPPHLHRVP